MVNDIEVSDTAQSGLRAERIGERELAISRLFDQPPHLVYRAWSQADLFRRWWIPESISGMSLLSCEMEVRTGGSYRLVFGTGGGDTFAFHGIYLDVVPDERMVWTNDEGEEGAVTTVTFEDHGGKTRLIVHETYPSEDAREQALVGGAAALPEQLEQLAKLLAMLAG